MSVSSLEVLVTSASTTAPFSHALRVLFPAGGVVVDELAALDELAAVSDFGVGDGRRL
jgi:hypothetical protein